MAAIDSDSSDLPEYSSPPCFMHEIESASSLPDPRQGKDVARWRKAERERLLAARIAIPVADRQRHTGRIIEKLDKAIGNFSNRIVSVYWPFRGEPDLREWMETATNRGATCALPVVIEKKAPLIFRAWRRGEALAKGVWNIPVPEHGAEVIPDIVISPVVGFDRQCYRLGYGGGFFDRTLAAHGGKPLVIGVGYGDQEIATIYPQPHDIPMSVILTEREQVTPR